MQEVGGTSWSLWQRGKTAVYKETTKLPSIHLTVSLPFGILDIPPAGRQHLGMHGAQFPAIAVCIWRSGLQVLGFEFPS